MDIQYKNAIHTGYVADKQPTTTINILFIVTQTITLRKN